MSALAPIDPSRYEKEDVIKVQAFVRGCLCRARVGIMVQKLIDELLRKRDRRRTKRPNARKATAATGESSASSRISTDIDESARTNTENIAETEHSTSSMGMTDIKPVAVANKPSKESNMQGSTASLTNNSVHSIRSRFENKAVSNATSPWWKKKKVNQDAKKEIVLQMSTSHDNNNDDDDDDVASPALSPPTEEEEEEDPTDEGEFGEEEEEDLPAKDAEPPSKEKTEAPAAVPTKPKANSLRSRYEAQASGAPSIPPWVRKRQEREQKERETLQAPLEASKDKSIAETPAEETPNSEEDEPSESEEVNSEQSESDDVDSDEEEEEKVSKAPAKGPQNSYLQNIQQSDAAAKISSSEHRIEEQKNRINEEIQQLLKDVQRIGDPEESSVKFGDLFDDEEVANYYEALVGTLKAAKRKGLIEYKGQFLMKGLNDNVVISIVST